MIAAQSRPCRRERILAQSAAEEAMLLDLDGGTYFALNDVGARVWALCDGSNTVAHIATILADEYEAPPDVILHDVLDLLGQLAAEQLVLVT